MLETPAHPYPYPFTYTYLLPIPHHNQNHSYKQPVDALGMVFVGHKTNALVTQIISAQIVPFVTAHMIMLLLIHL
jgi:hypothetical protein